MSHIELIGVMRGEGHPKYSIRKNGENDLLSIYRNETFLFGPFFGHQLSICSDIINTLAFGLYWDRKNRDENSEQFPEFEIHSGRGGGTS